MKKLKNISTILFCGLILFGLSLFAWVKAPAGYSMTERRTLSQAPVLSWKAMEKGTYMEKFEAYATDQFPMRDGFRTLKAVTMKNLFAMRDNHGLYTEDGYLSKLEYPLNKAKVGISVNKLNEIRKEYLADTACKTYLSIIPDKNYFLAPKKGYPILDYDTLIDTVKDQVKTECYIDIFDLLSLEDYYFTDQHWKQECILDVAERIGNAMTDEKFEIKESNYERNLIEMPFYGAYVGQAALPTDNYGSDLITYLSNQEMDACLVTSYNSGKPSKAFLYDLSKGYGRDPYEMFLSGSDPLLVIENPTRKNGRELVVFRDSFGSSLIPLLTAWYEKITVVDLRYMRSNLLGDYLDFQNQDVLFLYSTLIFNNHISM
ncbi:MAG: DHHW family protein [Dorea sp.]|nr:DHHW family protein [Dorea sp.]